MYLSLHPISGGYPVVCTAVGRNLYPYTRRVPRGADPCSIVKQKTSYLDWKLKRIRARPMGYAQLKEDDQHLQVCRNYHFEISPNLVQLLSKPRLNRRK